MHDEYKIPAIEDIRDRHRDQPVRESLLATIDAAERLIASIDLDEHYRVAQILSRVNGDRPAAAQGKALGRDLVHDLRLLVEDLSDVADLQADAMGEQVFTVEELAQQFNVSTKTISRWRALGLVSRRLVFDGRKRVGFLRSSVDRFVKNSAERVERGAKFSQLSPTQRQAFIVRARQMANEGGGQAEIARTLAERSGRSVETIRAALRQHDIDNPEEAIFPTVGSPLTEVQKHNIYQAYRRGSSVEKLCNDYQRTKTTIYRVINEVRAQRIMELPLDYIDNARFARKGADAACLGEMPEPETATRTSRRVEPPCVGEGRHGAALSPDREGEERDHPGQSPPGRLDRQAARHPGSKLLRTGQRRKRLAVAGD